MNATWRCIKCHHVCTDDQLSHEGELKTCPICGGMVCDVTHTKVGEHFLTKVEDLISAQHAINGDER